MAIDPEGALRAGLLVRGGVYSRREISAHLGGSPFKMLPFRGGEVLSITFDPALQPGPEILLIAEGIEAYDAAMLLHHEQRYLTFQLHGAGQWELLGWYKVRALETGRRELDRLARAHKRKDRLGIAVYLAPQDETPGTPANGHVVPDGESTVVPLAGQDLGWPEAEVRRAIEMRAMEMAIAHDQALGWTVADVSQGNPYDLHCRRSGGQERRVEVKGTTTAGAGIFLTVNEVTHARQQYPQVALFVVANVRIAATTSGTLLATGGDPLIFDPWRIDDGQLRPLQFEYILPNKR